MVLIVLAVTPRARATARVGSVWRQREVIAGSNFKNQNQLVQHVGLNAATIIDEIRVTWPGGATRTLAKYPSNQRWSLYPVDKLGDSDRDGDRDLVDLAGLVACLTGPQPASIQPGCEMMDYDGDGDSDLPDFAAFQAAYAD